MFDTIIIRRSFRIFIIGRNPARETGKIQGG